MNKIQIIFFLLITGLIGCENNNEYDACIKADSQELEELANKIYTELQSQGYHLTGDVLFATVEAEYPDGSFTRNGINCMGYIQWKNNEWFIEVTRPYQNWVVEHELKHACGIDVDKDQKYYLPFH